MPVLAGIAAAAAAARAAAAVPPATTLATCVYPGAIAGAAVVFAPPMASVAFFYPARLSTGHPGVLVGRFLRMLLDRVQHFMAESIETAAFRQPLEMSDMLLCLTFARAVVLMHAGGMGAACFALDAVGNLHCEGNHR